MSAHDLPHLNAFLNALSSVFLISGFILIKQGRRQAHRRAMLAAVVTSSLFLISYLVYHFQVGSVKSTGRGTIRTVYLTILLTHTVLAAVVPPLAVVTLVRALRERFDAHRRIARITWPIWMYVSVTGVTVYWMLYRM